MRAPLVKTEQDSPICIQNLTEVVMRRMGRGLTKERLVPSEAVGDVADPDDRPCTFHRMPPDGWGVGVKRRSKGDEPVRCARMSDGWHLDTGGFTLDPCSRRIRHG